VRPPRRFLVRLSKAAAPFAAAAVLLATARCGLLVSPGDYTSGGDDKADGSAATAPPGDAKLPPEGPGIPDGSVIPSIGTLALMAGEREPTSVDDDPAWSADAWSGVIGLDGRVVSWRIDKSAPIVGAFESAGLVGSTWVMINDGFGLAGGRGLALQTTSWAPGIVGDWRAARATGAPGGLEDYARVFFGTHVLYVGGVRTSAGVDGGPPSTYFTKELHVADVDVANNALSGTTDPGGQLNLARARPGVLCTGANVYVVGGRFSGGLASSVEMAVVDGVAGTVAAFSEQPALMSAGEEYGVFLPQVAEVGGYLFVAGGRINGASAPTDIVVAAKILADKTLGPFQDVTALPMPLRDFAFVGFKGRLYVAGGQGAAGRSDVVYSASVDADGKLGAWDATNAKLPGQRSDFVALAY
jgi:hypothetical protein